MSTADLRSPLIDLLERYKGFDAEEEAMRENMLAFVRRSPNCFLRSLEEGHLTASAWVVNPDRSAAVMMFHRKLNRWLQPGGHADGDPDLLQVALKEVSEETGLQATPVSPEIFDVDIHEIPANAHVPAHLHYDVRFLLEIGHAHPLRINEESLKLAWIPMQQIAAHNSERSVLRLAEKVEPTNIL